MRYYLQQHIRKFCFLENRHFLSSEKRLTEFDCTTTTSMRAQKEGREKFSFACVPSRPIYSTYNIIVVVVVVVVLL